MYQSSSSFPLDSLVRFRASMTYSHLLHRMQYLMEFVSLSCNTVNNSQPFGTCVVFLKDTMSTLLVSFWFLLFWYISFISAQDNAVSFCTSSFDSSLDSSFELVDGDVETAYAVVACPVG